MVTLTEQHTVIERAKVTVYQSIGVFADGRDHSSTCGSKIEAIKKVGVRLMAALTEKRITIERAKVTVYQSIRVFADRERIVDRLTVAKLERSKR